MRWWPYNVVSGAMGAAVTSEVSVTGVHSAAVSAFYIPFRCSAQAGPRASVLNLGGPFEIERTHAVGREPASPSAPSGAVRLLAGGAQPRARVAHDARPHVAARCLAEGACQNVNVIRRER